MKRYSVVIALMDDEDALMTVGTGPIDDAEAVSNFMDAIVSIFDEEVLRDVQAQLEPAQIPERRLN
ncbi:hypothetical protein [Herbaspirillum sp.]|uniref:hypothetical protein n=1 Tax=Herbaspirillum sp. TaxID=1890675 RepID=UPI000C0AC1B9|nr:hypothetical protein [Herbaspirillum sp.]MAF04403.1 hypothetical protein [Herbaspirillum sp.]|tara:strand:- start:37414 stop:37611 length:198 start_codon:yes stop_codon:yes gene_type:complete